MNEKDFNKVFSENLNRYLQKNNMSQSELAKRIKVSDTSVMYWCKGMKTPRMDKVDKMCDVFHIERSDLMNEKNGSESDHPTKIHAVQIPVLGYVRAGIPIDAVEEILDYEEISPEMAAGGDYFALKVKGDSMEPRISEGDVVIVREQPEVESGEIAIVLINGDDATVKRFVRYDNGSIALVAFNPAYHPMIFTPDQIESLPVRVIGKVVELRAKF